MKVKLTWILQWSSLVKYDIDLEGQLRHGQWGGVSQNPPVIEKIGKTPPVRRNRTPPPIAARSAATKF